MYCANLTDHVGYSPRIFAYICMYIYQQVLSMKNIHMYVYVKFGTSYNCECFYCNLTIPCFSI